MTPEELQTLYDALQTVPATAGNVATTQLGQQQAAQGPLAGSMGTAGGVANPSNGNGIGAYTQNRLIQPTINTLTQSLITEGKQNVLNQRLKDLQTAAVNDYNSAKQSYYSRSSSSGSSGSSSGSSDTTTDGGVTVSESGLGQNVEKPNLTYDEVRSTVINKQKEVQQWYLNNPSQLVYPDSSRTVPGLSYDRNNYVNVYSNGKVTAKSLITGK